MPTALPAATEHEYQSAERTLWRRIVVAMVIAAPIGALVFAVLTAAAASMAGVALAGPAAAGAVIGVLGGVFWGMWGAVCAGVAEFERLEGHPHKTKKRGADEPSPRRQARAFAVREPLRYPQSDRARRQRHSQSA